MLYILLLLLLAQCGLLKDTGAEEEFHPGVSGRYYIHVSSTRGDDSNDGSKSRPLQSFSEAVSRVSTLPHPFTIRLAAGNYPLETILENVHGSISGKWNESFTAQDENGPESVLDSELVALNSNLILENLTFRNSTVFTDEGALLGILGGRYTIKGCNFELLANGEIYAVFAYVQEFVFENNRVLLPPNARSGALLMRSDSFHLKNNTFTGSSLLADSNGPILCGSGSIENNTFEFSGGLNINALSIFNFGEYHIGHVDIVVKNNDFRLSSAAGQYGIRVFSDEGDFEFTNNTIRNAHLGFGMDGGISTMKIRNNTIYNVTSGIAFGGSLVNGTYLIENNLISNVAGTCIAEFFTGVYPGLQRIKNNAFSCAFAYRDRDSNCGGGVDCTLAQMEALTDLQASNNVNSTPIFTNAGAGDFRLADACPTQIKEGGINGASEGWSFSTDKAGAPRTPNWSIGAYEY